MSRADGIDLLSINAIRSLTIDATQAADSGHPGAPMGIAPVAYTLFTRFLRFDPANPGWPARDRFVLSAGHASMLLYSLLYLTGYDLSIEDIREFRQLGSRTPGHPEAGTTPGVEVTTGPLGQGVSNAVGMALARKLIGARFNRPGFDLTDYYVYAICSDGDLMEGVSSEACSLAGHLGLDRLICLYDDNRITIEGSTGLSFSEDIPGRFEASGWHVSRVEDANDIDSVAGAIEEARGIRDRPALIAARSRIACGSPNLEGCEKTHGAPLGDEEALLTKKNLGWPEGEPFEVPEEVLAHMGTPAERGRELESAWWSNFSDYESEYPELAADWRRAMEGKLPEGWREALPDFEAGGKVATRAASGKVLGALAPVIWELVGGSADLGPSNKTLISGAGDVLRGHFEGRNLHFGVREHAMASVMNGMAAHGGLIPYGGTFLVFSDYMRPAIRLAALSSHHVIYVFTHDSLGVGEDGPTHQPVEHLAALRAMPGLVVIRPCDANETAEAWAVALEQGGPVALVLSRQGLPVLDRKDLAAASGLRRGAYVLAGGEDAEIVMVATGSEVALALGARDRLGADGVSTRVVSMPSWELFDAQPEEYRSEVLPPGVPRLVVEAGVSMGWQKYMEPGSDIIAVERFGLSAPGSVALAEAGYGVDNVTARAGALLKEDAAGA